MRTISKLLFLAVFALSMSSCGSDEGNPVLTVTLNNADNSFAPGEVANFVINATDDTGVTSITIDNSDLGISESINEFGGANSGVELTVEYALTLGNAAGTGDFKIKFEATDLDGNTADEEIEITITE